MDTRSMGPLPVHPAEPRSSTDATGGTPPAPSLPYPLAVRILLDLDRSLVTVSGHAVTSERTQ